MVGSFGFVVMTLSFVVMSFVFIMIVCDGLVVMAFMTSIFTIARAQDELSHDSYKDKFLHKCCFPTKFYCFCTLQR